jgi:hypothetical protein
MSVRMRRPEEVTVPVSQGDSLTLKKFLTTGETRQMFASMMQEDGDKLDRSKVGMAKVAAYLLDWTFDDADGKRIAIKDQPQDVVMSILDNLPSADFREVLQAVEKHDETNEAEIQAAKNGQDGESKSAATSPSAS